VLLALASISRVEGPEDKQQPEELLRAPAPPRESAALAPREEEIV
jgi:hypothetical protein